MEFVLFGQVQGMHRGQPVELGRRQERCLMGLLLVEAGRAVTTDRLADLLWDGVPPPRARGVIQTYVARLRRLLAPYGVVITSGSGGYCAEVAARDVDLHRFQLAVTAARQVGAAAERADALSAALGLWHGPVLGSEASDQLRARVGGVYDEMRLAAVKQCAEAYLDAGQPDRAVLALAPADDDHPVREQLVGLQMTALAEAGRTAEALAAYRTARGRMRSELGMEPGRELSQVHERILRGGHRPGPGADTATPRPEVQVAGGPGQPGPAERPVPRQLPADLEVFAGRHAVLKELDGIAPSSSGGRPGDPAVLAVLHGTAGVGKTAVAVHWAHLVRDGFSGGQLYVNLRGYGPGPATTPGQALRGFLDALGVPARAVPATEPDQAGLYRSLVAGQRLLIVLDNAGDAEQVRPLLPASPGCMVVVTSRDQLAGLVAVEGAHSVPLGLPSAGDARDLIARRLGPERVAGDPQAAAMIIGECARLPLALAIVAARAAASPGFPLAALAASLGEGRGSLDVFATGDPGSELRTVFSWSYRALSPGAARLFRLLGLHPGPEVSVQAAASTAGLTVRQAAPLLAELTRAHLAEEAAPGRYTTHDLLSAYAAELTTRHEEASVRDAARQRMLGHYVQTAHAADHLIRSPGDPLVPLPATEGVTVGTVADLAEALEWFAAEYPVLAAMGELAARTGHPASAWQLAWAMTGFLERQGRPLDLIAAQLTALGAAEEAGDRTGQSRAHHSLALAYMEMDQLDDGLRQLWLALDLCAGLGDQAARASLHTSIAWILSRQGHLADAAAHYEQALVLFAETGLHGAYARALNNAGWALALAGNYHRAAKYCEQALGQLRELGDQHGQASTLDSLGYVHQKLGQYQQSVDCYRSAVELSDQTGARVLGATSLTGLGDSYLALGDRAAAQRAWREALTVLDDVGHPDAAQARARLTGACGAD